MNKVAVFLGVILLICSCKQADYNYDFIIRNNSETVNVSFDFNGSLVNVPANNIEDVKLGMAHYTALTNIKANGYPMAGGYPKIINVNKVFSDNFITYNFNDLPSYILNIENTLPMEIFIKAGDYINNNGNIVLEISANGSSSGINIYTDKPKFSAFYKDDTDPENPYKPFPFPVTFDWHITKNYTPRNEDESSIPGEMEVLIR